MKAAVLPLLVMGCVTLVGCSGSASHHKACEVISPATVNVPTTENSQRVEQAATGVPVEDRMEQNCP